MKPHTVEEYLAICKWVEERQAPDGLIEKVEQALNAAIPYPPTDVTATRLHETGQPVNSAKEAKGMAVSPQRRSQQEQKTGVKVTEQAAESIAAAALVRDRTSSRVRRAVIWDVGGVLADDMHGPYLDELAVDYPALRQAAVRRGIKVAWDGLKVSPDRGSEDRFWEVVKELGEVRESVPTLKRMLRTRMRVFWGPMAVVERLKRKGYLLAILSNHAKAWFEDLAILCCFDNLFDKIVVSCDIGCAKPSEAAFEQLMVQLRGIQPLETSQCLFIDDQKPNTDIAGKLGFAAEVFDARKHSVGDLARLLDRSGIKELGSWPSE
jgi:HAD superfamily hydrolase (TIGR01509 family)